MLIFNVYLFLLPGFACAGEDDCKDDLQTVLTTTTNHNEHGKADCGDFCSCTCCVHLVSVNFQTVLTGINKLIVKKSKFSFYNNISLPSNYFGNIWQPPKML